MIELIIIVICFLVVAFIVLTVGRFILTGVGLLGMVLWGFGQIIVGMCRGDIKLSEEMRPRRFVAEVEAELREVRKNSDRLLSESRILRETIIKNQVTLGKSTLSDAEKPDLRVLAAEQRERLLTRSRAQPPL